MGAAAASTFDGISGVMLTPFVVGAEWGECTTGPLADLPSSVLAPLGVGVIVGEAEGGMLAGLPEPGTANGGLGMEGEEGGG